MYELEYITSKFSDFQKLNLDFVETQPHPIIVLDDFLPANSAQSLQKECESIPNEHWTEFTRRGSYMKECKNLDYSPEAVNVVNQLNSGQSLRWLEKVTGIQGLLPDPHLTGAGYSRSFNGDSLKVHTDFNWNDELRLHRKLTLIVYLTEEWQEQYGGHIEFYDNDNNQLVQKIFTKFNRCVIWQYHKTGFHGYPTPIQCPAHLSRNTLRLFYYVSNSQYLDDDPPHRSLYWYDNNTNTAYDNRTQK
jgi:Rps23 Pro-64 3,4-dihydroxylase Tpa1-like proline 4-hydroxylase